MNYRVIVEHRSENEAPLKLFANAVMHGMVVGAAVAGLIGALLVALLGAIIGAIIGAAIGAVIGAGNGLAHLVHNRRGRPKIHKIHYRRL
jgi:outer membrane lipoprotein SlyB